jgi:hypothetical protein
MRRLRRQDAVAVPHRSGPLGIVSPGMGGRPGGCRGTFELRTRLSRVRGRQNTTRPRTYGRQNALRLDASRITGTEFAGITFGIDGDDGRHRVSAGA